MSKKARTLIRRPAPWLTPAQRAWVMAAFDDFAAGFLSTAEQADRPHFVALLNRRTRASWRVPPHRGAFTRRLMMLERKKQDLERQQVHLQMHIRSIDSAIVGARAELRRHESKG